MTQSKQTTLSDLKDQARRLRQALAASGTTINHSRALELLALQHGARDWNTLAAQAPRGPTLPDVGSQVSGYYMGHHYTGQLKSLSWLSDKGVYRVSIQLDEPIDAVSFDSFSALRHRVSGTLDRTGTSFRRRSDGVPHLVMKLPSQ